MHSPQADPSLRSRPGQLGLGEHRHRGVEARPAPRRRPGRGRDLGRHRRAHHGGHRRLMWTAFKECGRTSSPTQRPHRGGRQLSHGAGAVGGAVGHRDGDRGAGVFSASIGLLVFLMFLFFAMQVMFRLYATSTLRATLNDAVAWAAAGVAVGPAELRAIAADAEGSLGEMGGGPRPSSSSRPSTRTATACPMSSSGGPSPPALRAAVDRRDDRLRAGHRRCPGPDRAGALAPVETAVAPTHYRG